MVPCYGPTLIFAPPNLVPHWLKEVNEYLNQDKWEFRYAYQEPKHREFESKLDSSDYEWVEPLDTAPYFNVHYSRVSFIVVTTSGSYHGHVEKLLATYHYSVP